MKGTARNISAVPVPAACIPYTVEHPSAADTHDITESPDRFSMAIVMYRHPTVKGPGYAREQMGF